jgi:hypothetical protein
MVPARFVRLDRLPLTPNGKLDRSALPTPSRPAPAPAAPPSPAQPVALPAAGIETELAAIWRRLLGVEVLGPRDNFFALGGHSLLAVQLHREIRDRLGEGRIAITDIFRFPVFDAMLRHLRGADTSAAPPPATLPPQVDRDEAMARRQAMRARRMGQDA